MAHKHGLHEDVVLIDQSQFRQRLRELYACYVVGKLSLLVHIVEVLDLNPVCVQQ
jgi:hypothetical protein